MRKEKITIQQTFNQKNSIKKHEFLLIRQMVKHKTRSIIFICYVMRQVCVCVFVCVCVCDL